MASQSDRPTPAISTASLTLWSGEPAPDIGLADVAGVRRYLAGPDLLALRKVVDGSVIAGDSAGASIAYLGREPARAPAIKLGPRLTGAILIWPFRLERVWAKSQRAQHPRHVLLGNHRGLFLTLARITDKEQEDRVSRWYVDKHIPELLETKGFDAAARFRGLGPAAGGCFLHLYFLGEDPVVANANLRAGGSRWREEERALGLDSLRRPILHSFYRPVDRH